MKPYWNPAGLLNPHKENNFSENTLLCSMVYKQKGGNLSACTIDAYIKSCKDGEWFNNLPFINTDVENDKWTSPDQLNVYMLWNLDNAKQIFKTLVKKLGTYDNISRKISFGQMQQPMTLSLAGYLGFSKILFFFPLLATMLYSCITAKEATSGKQKVWLILQYRMPKLFNIFNKFWKLDDAVRIYYPADHPINLL